MRLVMDGFSDQTELVTTDMYWSKLCVGLMILTLLLYICAKKRLDFRRCVAPQWQWMC